MYFILMISLEGVTNNFICQYEFMEYESCICSTDISTQNCLKLNKTLNLTITSTNILVSVSPLFAFSRHEEMIMIACFVVVVVVEIR